jgi:hypothetical protein
MAVNDPKVIAKLLRAIAGSDNAKAANHDVIFAAAARLLDPPPSGLETQNEHSDPCPECKTQLIAQRRGGVKCPNCSYWFCY